MPLYDNIVDAFELLPGGGPVSLTNIGATEETNENANAAGNAGVWVKVDLSAWPAGDDVPITLGVTGVTGTGFHPYMDSMKVNDASFDPASPDFTKLSFTSATALGDGTASPPDVVLALKGGTGSSTGNRSQTGIFYIYFTDWDYDGSEGSATVSYIVPPTPVCYDAIDIINPDSPSASIVSGRVQEDWLDWWDFGSNAYNFPQKTLKFTWAGDAGAYRVRVFGQLSAAGSGVVNAIVTVNGRPFLGVGGRSFSGTTPNAFFAYNGFDAATADTYQPSDYGANPWVILAPGDAVEVMIMSHADLTGFSGFNAFQCSSICFYKDDVATDTCTGGVRFDDAPLGDDWGDVDGWGGQRLIPDEIYAWLGVGPDDSHTIGVDFPWGINYTDFDFVALADGTVYVLLHDARNFVGGTPAAENHYLVVKKYDPGGGTWTQIATLNVNDPTTHYPIDSANVEYDGTYVYFAWWELDTYTPGSPAKYLWKWHMVRLDPTDDSYTELGTGQHAEGVTNQSANYDMIGVEGTTLGISIAFSGDDIYAGVVEIPDNAWAGGDLYRTRPYVWRWNGSTWANTSLPDPSATAAPPGTSAFNTYEVIGENQRWDVLVNLVAANKDGLKTDGVTAIYNYRYWHAGDGFDHYPLVTIEYTAGSGWSGEVLTDLATLEGSGRISSPVAWRTLAVDMTPLWSEKLGKLVLAVDTGSQIWDLLQLGSTDWEIIEATAPPSSAGTWRQTRNSAAIGPDGDVWRGMMSDEIDATDFEPHVIKHSPGYSFGFANGARKPIGSISAWTDPQSKVWSGSYVAMSVTTNYRIRWVGSSCYIMACLYIEPQLVDDLLFADSPLYPSSWPSGEGFYVIKGTYAPCTRFLPHFYRRVLG